MRVLLGKSIIAGRGLCSRGLSGSDRNLTHVAGACLIDCRVCGKLVSFQYRSGAVWSGKALQ